MKECPSYTYEISTNKYLGNDKEYYLITIVHWSDNTSKAHEVGHKAFYCADTYLNIVKFFNNDYYCKLIYDTMPNYSILFKRRVL